MEKKLILLLALGLFLQVVFIDAQRRGGGRFRQMMMMRERERALRRAFPFGMGGPAAAARLARARALRQRVPALLGLGTPDIGINPFAASPLSGFGSPFFGTDFSSFSPAELMSSGLFAGEQNAFGLPGTVDFGSMDITGTGGAASNTVDSSDSFPTGVPGGNPFFGQVGMGGQQIPNTIFGQTSQAFPDVPSMPMIPANPTSTTNQGNQQTGNSGMQMPPTGNPGMQMTPGGNPGMQMTPGGNMGMQMTPGGNPGMQMTPGGNMGMQMTPGGNMGMQMTPGGNPGMQMTPGGNMGMQMTPGGNMGMQMTPGGNPGMQMTPGGNMGMQMTPGGNMGMQMTPGGNMGMQMTPGGNMGMQMTPGVNTGMQMTPGGNAGFQFPTQGMNPTGFNVQGNAIFPSQSMQSDIFRQQIGGFPEMPSGLTFPSEPSVPTIPQVSETTVNQPQNQQQNQQATFGGSSNMLATGGQQMFMPNGAPFNPQMAAMNGEFPTNMLSPQDMQNMMNMQNQFMNNQILPVDQRTGTQGRFGQTGAGPEISTATQSGNQQQNFNIQFQPLTSVPTIPAQGGQQLTTFTNQFAGNQPMTFGTGAPTTQNQAQAQQQGDGTIQFGTSSSGNNVVSTSTGNFNTQPGTTGGNTEFKVVEVGNILDPRFGQNSASTSKAVIVESRQPSNGFSPVGDITNFDTFPGGVQDLTAGPTNTIVSTNTITNPGVNNVANVDANTNVNTNTLVTSGSQSSVTNPLNQQDFSFFADNNSPSGSNTASSGGATMTVLKTTSTTGQGGEGFSLVQSNTVDSTSEVTSSGGEMATNDVKPSIKIPALTDTSTASV